MIEQLDRIKNKLEQLKRFDKDLKLFGADTHEYLLNPILTSEQVTQFETDHKIDLPKDYVSFLTTIGNGGAGPFYGVNTLGDSRIIYFDNKEKGNHQYFDLSKAFPHIESWNVENELQELYEKIEKANEAGNEELEEELFKQKWEIIGGEEHDFGRLNTTDYGCGVTISLIVNGQEKGNMWTDDRTNDAGLYPTIELGNKGRITFLNWYELWLDNSLKEIQSKTQNGR
ncbi:SMI1/KNR4 family protein [Chryseobacterium luteum]|uniref:Uncharacterized protein n=1 Tax=Chryseobacterium luteum TaxID=421531 RepID=A0A085ZEE3_9FLAO|nr:SMI1/KNR4 family protein [Chryseobacterium luteum]KFF02807.1 hypothetical protein IX38_12615 [Chryseobacterium luteum]